MRRKQTAFLEMVVSLSSETMWQFINSIKTVPGHEEASLWWHLPMLDDILAAQH